MVTSQYDPVYVMGHSDTETARLQRQAQLYGPATRRLFIEAGIGSGMRVLDVGSGAGDVALLVAELVGSGGQVVGDQSSATITSRSAGTFTLRGEAPHVTGSNGR